MAPIDTRSLKSYTYQKVRRIIKAYRPNRKKLKLFDVPPNSVELARMPFITFEGVDGSGKSTQAELLAERIRDIGHVVLHVREPGGTRLGEAVRSLLLDPSMDIGALSEMLLFSAARAQLVSQVIRPALARGEVVICDRFFDSTTVYQGIARNLGEIAWMKQFHHRVTGGLVPARTYLLDLPFETAQARRASRNGPGADDRMERAGAEFLIEVVTGYRELAESEPRMQIVDGTRPIDDIAAEIWADVQVLLNERSGTAA